MPLESKAVRNSDPHFDYGSHTTSASSWCVTRARGGHYCFGSCIIMGAKYQHGLGALLYKMGKTRATKNTQHTHNNQHERPPPYSPAACPPPLSMGRAKFSQIIMPLLPYECVQFESRWACARRRRGNAVVLLRQSN